MARKSSGCPAPTTPASPRRRLWRKRLKKSGEIKHRDDLGREKFLERVWQWKEKHGGIIIQQLKKLGASCDWTRERFTMDPEYSRCVQKVFVELYKKGLIYRGKRMVNWCPASLTALSDEEVVMKEQKGSLYYFKVEVAEAPGTFLTIATTRPETIPGDTAVAVNPKDPRYAKYIGKHVVRPLPAELPREQKLIPIIGDEHVDFEFGTGVLKVTPAHDKADFEIGQRHKLAQIEVIDANGHMNELAGADLNGLDRFKARKVAVEKLTELGALEKEEPYTNNVGYSERADVPIEPRLSEQWFLKYPSVEKSRECVAQEGSATVPVAASGVSPDASSRGGIPFGGTPNGADGTSALPGKMHFHPQRWAKVYDHWMGGIKTGASAASFGGDIGFRCGIENTKQKQKVYPKTATLELSHHLTWKIGNKTPTCSTPGSVRGSGRLRRWAGRSRPTR